MTISAAKTSFRCSECGWDTSRWVGRCGQCRGWGTVAQIVGTVGQVPGRGGLRVAAVSAAARPIAQVEADHACPVPTGIAEFDRVLGGGLVPGAVVLLAGEPGVGKSTLLLQVAAASARAGRTCLYITGEESAAQVRARAARVGAVVDGVHLAAETLVTAIPTHVDAVAPGLLVVDSVQTMVVPGLAGAVSGVSQVREAAAALIQLAKDRALATVLVGHVTKDGAIAGPRTLEHLVDVVLSFEGDRHGRLRMVRAIKNRYGPTDEVGCFELGGSGLAELPDPSGLFRSHSDQPVPGTAVTVALDGRRPMLVEVQALAAPASGHPRRVTTGLDAGRMAMVCAILERRAGLPLARLDCYLAPVGGARLVEPAADLAVALALSGSVRDQAVPVGWAVFGELGLAGEVRRVPGAAQRVAEATRLGVTDVMLPRADAADLGPVVGRGAAVRLHPVDDLVGALRRVAWVRTDLPALTVRDGPRALALVAEAGG